MEMYRLCDKRVYTHDALLVCFKAQGTIIFLWLLKNGDVVWEPRTEFVSREEPPDVVRLI